MAWMMVVKKESQSSTPSPQPLSGRAMTWTVLMKKEFLEQLRTHRLTVMAVAFVFFGLSSPLMAKLLPELVKATAGEMAIQLPPPTALFALDQYLKNLTQMGLLVVVLTAMGSIAGERERGTAAMTLCKPVSRVAFVGSKFLAYSALLALGLALSAVSCYYYTAILFERLDPLAFAAATALLGLYLLVILSVTLLASAIFRSTLAAGGLAFGLALAVSLVGSLPGIEQYGPAALVAWGRTLISGVGPVAWPALFVSLGLVVLCAVVAWAVFRRHEI
ncbi:MAG: ABC transporter permease [Chloroflexota bacterium]|nr:MAG: ABC transporter permease [Chloroflexota bacterium]